MVLHLFQLIVFLYYFFIIIVELLFQTIPLLISNLRNNKSEIPKDVNINDTIHPTEFVITLTLLNSDYDFTIAGICNINVFIIIFYLFILE